MGDQTVGLQARLMSQALRKLAGNLNRANTVCVFTNQIREKVGVMFGSPETQPGGRALKFYASQRIDIRRIETLKEGTEAVGNRVRAKIVKNKVAAPFRQAEFDIEYGDGISSEGCLLDLGIEHGIVQKSGAFFSYDGERLGQGRNNAKGFLRENPRSPRRSRRKVYEARRRSSRPRRPRRRWSRRRTRRRGRPWPRSRRPRRLRDGRSRHGRLRPRPPEDERAVQLAYRALGRRERTVAELRTRAGAQARGARGDRCGRQRVAASRAGSTTPATPSASPRTSARSTTGARSGSRATCAGGAWRPSTSRRRSRRRDRADELATALCCSSRDCPPPPATTASATRLAAAGPRGLRARAGLRGRAALRAAGERRRCAA